MADFLYLRFLGDRKRMHEHVEGLISGGEKQRHWDKLVWGRGVETGRWAQQVREMMEPEPEGEVYAFFNNHYAGYAPGSLGIFARAWKED